MARRVEFTRKIWWRWWGVIAFVWIVAVVSTTEKVSWVSGAGVFLTGAFPIVLALVLLRAPKEGKRK